MANEAPKKATRSLKRPPTRTSTSMTLSPETKELSIGYCRKCQRNRALKSNFYIATDKLLDTNGYMSVCKDCVETLFDKFYSSEGSLDKAILKLCRLLNVRFDGTALESTRKQIQTMETKGKDPGGIFGIYRKSLISATAGFGGFGQGEEDLTYQEGASYNVTNPLPEDFEASDYLKEFWGSDLDISDYAFLEREFAKFKETHKADTYAEKVLLKLVCFKILEIEKTRKNGSTAGKEKELQELMKNLAISPQYAKAVSDGKNLDAFGVWIAEIEQNEPAQWLEGEGHDMFRDVADVEGYFQKYFVRPLKNAILQSKDFNVDDDMDEFEEYDMEDSNDDEEHQTISEQ